MPEHTVITQKQDANRRNAGRSHTRQSNFEMLRIVSMMLVLVLHADFLSLGIPKANDFYTDPTNAWTRTLLEGQRFVLSTRSLPYKIVRSFGRMLRPVEMNVIENVPGNAIFLYDRLSPALRIRNARSDSFLYHYRINDMLSVMRGYGPGRLVRDAFSRLIGKITRN